MAGLAAQDPMRPLDHVRQRIEQGVLLFNIEVIEASRERGAVRLREGEHVARPGGTVAGSVQFALADVAT